MYREEKLWLGVESIEIKVVEQSCTNNVCLFMLSQVD